MSTKEARGDATPFLPERKNLKSLRGAAAYCRGCHLYAPATQTVFSDGPKRGRVMMVGEMPGDREDRAGKVFVGPAGREVDACMPWLRAELDVVKPTALLLLGATAGKALLGESFKLTQSRGRALDSDLAELVAATIHPSAILRARDDASRQAQRESFTADLRAVAESLAGR